MAAILRLQDFKPDREICQTIINAIGRIISLDGQKIDPEESQQYILEMIKFIARDFVKFDPPISSLGNDEAFTEYIISAVDGPDKKPWLSLLANEPKVWLPQLEPGDAVTIWIKTLFAKKVLGYLMEGEKETQDNLVEIIVHITSTGSTKWCEQLIDSRLADVVVESIDAEHSGAGDAKLLPVVDALRLLLAVFSADTSTDWANDQMHNAIGKLSEDISRPDSKTFRKLSDKDKGPLAKFIDHIGARRNFKGQAAENAIKRLKESSSKFFFPSYPLHCTLQANPLICRLSDTSGNTSESHPPETATP